MDYRYQSDLSHALHPTGSSSSHPPTYSSSGIYNVKQSMSSVSAAREEEEEDEGAVEEQLSRDDHEHDNADSGGPSSPRSQVPGTSKQEQTETSPPESESKRRPGRPRGSKNRKTHSSGSQPPGQKTLAFQGQSAGSSTTPPQHPDVNPHNHQYYEFQWRVLNLCAEFYGAAEELLKATPPLVLAQSFQMHASAVDPVVMVRDAKHTCDTLLGNPTRLISNPPPPIYPIIPQYYQAPLPPPPAPTASGKATTPGAVINQPQSFVVSMGAPGQYSYQYPPGSYYPYPPSYPPPPPGQVYYAPPPQPQASTSQSAAPGANNGTPTPTVSSSLAGVVGHQGPWSEEELERLKKLAEDGKEAGHTGDGMWDWVVHQWGSSRTRHQILIKATQLGLKESSGRGIKRRRGTTEDPGSPRTAPQPPALNKASLQASSSGTTAPSPHSQTTSPGTSPSLQHRSQPVTPAPTTSKLAWPMPTVAATTSPTVASTSSYYRPRPTGEKPIAGPINNHQYMYAPPSRHNGK